MWGLKQGSSRAQGDSLKYGSWAAYCGPAHVDETRDQAAEGAWPHSCGGGALAYALELWGCNGFIYCCWYLHLQDADIFGGDSDAEIPPNDPLPTNKAWVCCDWGAVSFWPSLYNLCTPRLELYIRILGMMEKMMELNKCLSMHQWWPSCNYSIACDWYHYALSGWFWTRLRHSRSPSLNRRQWRQHQILAALRSRAKSCKRNRPWKPRLRTSRKSLPVPRISIRLVPSMKRDWNLSRSN